jgi:hypothetical protein
VSSFTSISPDKLARLIGTALKGGFKSWKAGITLYDAFHRWCRDATGETHNWPSNKAKP